jgi:hypothetical protein
MIVNGPEILDKFVGEVPTFTCFTGTKVQILTPEELSRQAEKKIRALFAPSEAEWKAAGDASASKKK